MKKLNCTVISIDLQYTKNFISFYKSRKQKNREVSKKTSEENTLQDFFSFICKLFPVFQVFFLFEIKLLSLYHSYQIIIASNKSMA